MNELIPTRATLIERLKNWQDQSSWQDFFDTYWQLIYSVARKGGLTESEAQDVVQETMVAVAKQMPKFQYDPAIGSFKAWLLNMTRWRMRDQYRKRDPYGKLDSSLGETGYHIEVIDSLNPNLDELWEAEWRTNLFDAAMARVKRQVDPQKFQMFDFYVNKEWPPAKVAEAFDVPIAQVYLAKHRVTDLLKAEFKRLEMETT